MTICATICTSGYKRQNVAASHSHYYYCYGRRSACTTISSPRWWLVGVCATVSIIMIFCFVVYGREDEDMVHGFYVCNLRRLRLKRNCVAFSIGVNKSLDFEDKLYRILDGNCEVVVYRENRPRNIATYYGSPLRYVDGKLADYESYNASNAPHEAILETIVERHFHSKKIPLMVFDIGHRIALILTSRIMTLRPCQAILRVHFYDKRDAQKLVHAMAKASYQLVSIRQIRRQTASALRAQAVAAGGAPPRRNARIDNYAGVYHMTFCNLQCFEDFDCDREPPSNGAISSSFLERTRI